MIFFFFFSSRRRHTRCGRDWSSDVCSSDLERVAVMDHGKVIALGTPRELIASLAAEHVLEFAASDAPLLDHQLLSGLDGICSAMQRDGTWQLQVVELHRAVPALLAELRRQNAQLTELRTHSPTLEDV